MILHNSRPLPVPLLIPQCPALHWRTSHHLLPLKHLPMTRLLSVLVMVTTRLLPRRCTPLPWDLSCWTWTNPFQSHFSSWTIAHQTRKMSCLRLKTTRMDQLHQFPQPVIHKHHQWVVPIPLATAPTLPLTMVCRRDRGQCIAPAPLHVQQLVRVIRHLLEVRVIPHLLEVRATLPSP